MCPEEAARCHREQTRHRLTAGRRQTEDKDLPRRMYRNLKETDFSSWSHKRPGGRCDKKHVFIQNKI